MVQRATTEQAKSLAEVQLLTWRQAYAQILPQEFLDTLDAGLFERNFQDLIAHPQMSVWGAWDGDQALGYAVLGPKNEPERPGDFEIRALYVRPEAQGRGVGQALLRQSLPYELEKGHRSAIVWSFTENRPARTFYASLGGKHVASSEFEIAGRRFPDEGYLFEDLRRLIERLEPISIAPIQPDDDAMAVFRLVQRAYAPLAAEGLRFTATYQNASQIMSRLHEDRGFLIRRQGQIIGAFGMTYPEKPNYGDWVCPGSLASFQLFCVDPDCQGLGVGTRALRHMERLAKEWGAEWLALDTADTAAHLISFYRRNGFERVGSVDYRPSTNYLSVVLAKPILTGKY